MKRTSIWCSLGLLSLMCAALSHGRQSGALEGTSVVGPAEKPPTYQYHFENITIPRASAEEPRIQRVSTELALSYIEQGALAWKGEHQCVSCHTTGSYMVVRPLLTPQLGQPLEEMREFFVSTLHQQMVTNTAALQSSIGPAQVVYVAAGLAVWDAYVLHRLSPETGQALALMFKLQSDAGDWGSNDCWPPLESSAFQLATVAARAVGNAPGWLAQQHGGPLEAKVNRLKEYLRAERKLQGDYDRTALLWAASEFPGLLDKRTKQGLIEMIYRHQRPDGGWSIRTFALPEQWGSGNRAEKLRAEPDFADPPSDGHMTGLAILALRKAGVQASDPHIQRGISWLLNNQRASGRWWTRSLNTDTWHFITYSGTLYPVLALTLCDALPPVSPVASDELSDRPGKQTLEGAPVHPALPPLPAGLAGILHNSWALSSRYTFDNMSFYPNAFQDEELHLPGLRP